MKFQKKQKKLKQLVQTAVGFSQYRAHYKQNGIQDFNTVDFNDLPTIDRRFFYGDPILKKYSYLMKSRPDLNEKSPIVPFSQDDYQRLVEKEMDKFKQVGLKAGMTFSIPYFSANHLAPMINAAQQMKLKYICLEGTDNQTFHDIASFGVESLFVTRTFLERFRIYVSQLDDKSLRKYKFTHVITAGEKFDNFSEMADWLQKTFKATLVDTIGSRELQAYGIKFPGDEYYQFIHSDSNIEILDDQGKAAKQGRLVITPLWRQDLPMIRYETGDLVRLIDEKKGSFELIGQSNNGIKFGSILTSVPELSLEIRSNIVDKWWLKPIWKFVGYPNFFILFAKEQESGTHKINFFCNANKVALLVIKIQLLFYNLKIQKNNFGYCSLEITGSENLEKLRHQYKNDWYGDQRYI